MNANVQKILIHCLLPLIAGVLIYVLLRKPVTELHHWLGIGLCNDTLTIRTVKDSLWEQKILYVCELLRDSCKTPGYKILVVDTTQDVSAWDTRFEKKIHIRQCP